MGVLGEEPHAIADVGHALICVIHHGGASELWR